MNVSLVIAVKNGERFIAETLQSVMQQTQAPIEILVVDGQSSDASVRIARSFPSVRVLAQQSRGFAAAWNEGIAAARGDLIAIVDSDDRWQPQKLELQTASLRASPELGYVVAHARFFLEPGDQPPPGFNTALLEGSHPGYFPSNLLARRSLFEDVGRFDSQYGIGSDVEWFKRVRDRQVPHRLLPEVLLERRVHAGNLSYHPPDKASFNHQLLKLLKHSIDRTRKPS